MVLLAVKMVADVTETHNVIPSLEFKTCMTIKWLCSTKIKQTNKNSIISYSFCVSSV